MAAEGPPAEGPPAQEKRRVKKRFGEETEIGKKVLLEAVSEPPKKRRSRWEEQPPAAMSLSIGLNSSIILPAALAALVDINPEAIELQRQLNLINNKLQIMNTGLIIDDTPPERRSPSPPPIYNEIGARINTREQRIKDKLLKERTVSVETAELFRHPNCTAWRPGVVVSPRLMRAAATLCMACRVSTPPCMGPCFRGRRLHGDASVPSPEAV